MKNPLVDALRQADGECGNDVAEQQHIEVAEESSPASSEAGQSGGADLELLDMRPEPVDDPAGPVSLPPPNTGGETFETAAGTDMAPLALTAILSARGARLNHRASIISGVGRIAPLLCLLMMSAAAGGYVVFDRLAFNSFNEDLEELSERARSDSTGDQMPVGRQDLPATHVSVVRQISARNVKGGATEPEAAPVQVQATGISTKLAGSGQGTRPANDDMPIGIAHTISFGVDDKAYPLVRAAFDAYRQQDYELAEEKYLEALDIEPYHSNALAGLAAVYQQTGRVKDASATYQRLLGVDPGNTLAASAIISLRSNDVGWDAESELKLLSQRFPQAHQLHFALGTYFVEQDRWVDARHEFLAAQKLAPQNADYNFNVAVSMERLGEYNDARSYYQASLETAEKSSNVDEKTVTRHLAEMSAQLRDQP